MQLKPTWCIALLLCSLATLAWTCPEVDNPQAHAALVTQSQTLRAAASSDLGVSFAERATGDTTVYVARTDGKTVRSLVHGQLANIHAKKPQLALHWAGLRFGIDSKGHLTGIMVQRNKRWEPLDDAQQYRIATHHALTLPGTPYSILSTLEWAAVAAQ